MSEADRHAYMRHMDNIWYQKNALTTSFDDGMRKGRAEGEAIGLEKGEAIGLEKGKKLEKLETARNLKSLGDNIGYLVPPISVFWYRQFTLSDFHIG